MHFDDFQDYEEHSYYRRDRDRLFEKERQRKQALEKNFVFNITEYLKTMPDIVFTGDNNEKVDLEILLDILTDTEHGQTMENFVVKQLIKDQKYKLGIELNQFAKNFQKQMTAVDIHKEQNLKRWLNTFETIHPETRPQNFEVRHLKYAMQDGQNQKVYSKEESQMFSNRTHWTYSELQKALIKRQ